LVAVFGGVVGAEAEAEAAIGFFGGVAAGEEDVGGFEASAATSGSGACADVEAIEADEDGFGGGAASDPVGVTGEAGLGFGDGRRQTGIVAQGGDEGVAGGGFSFVGLGIEDGEGGGGPDNARYVFGTGAHFSFLASAAQEGFDRGAGFDAEDAETLGATPFVGGGTDEVGGVVVDVGEGLDGVGEEERTGCVDEPGAGGDIGDGASFVVGGHESDDENIGGEERGETFGEDAAAGGGGNEGDAEAEAFEKGLLMKNAVVFGAADEDLVASSFVGEGDADEGEGGTFGAAAGEVNFAKEGAEGGGELLAGEVNSVAGLATFVVEATWVTEIGL